ncbi:MAG: HDIG domain-containing protein [Candidatus Omnitrophica bacterium]|nr:HDIG domain-containing protein [Candidatus Omnitrophota bacterium]
MSLINDYPQLRVIQEIAEKEKSAIFLVGGMPRDYLLGLRKNDFDFAVSKGALKLARLFAQTIRGAFILLDEENKCGRVAKKEKGELFTYDFADFRSKTLLGDLSHRDFTINTLSVSLKEALGGKSVNCLIKDRKGGLKDLKSKLIRMTGGEVFKDDPLRILRAFSLRSTLGFKIEAKTISQIRKDNKLLSKASPERIREELFKILGTGNSAKIIKEMDKLGLIEAIIPQVKVMFSCFQGGYHDLDVWKHSLETLSEIDKLDSYAKAHPDLCGYLSENIASQRPRLSLIKLAALLHDIGKPDTKKKEQGKISFHGHERLGKAIVRDIACQLKLSTDERHILEDIVLWHLRPGYLSNMKKPTERSVYRFFRDAKKEAPGILFLSVADQRATRGPMTLKKDLKHHEKICFGLIGKYFDKAKEKPFVPLIDGYEIMKSLKIKPSVAVGKILAELKEKQILGKIKDKKEALVLAQKTYNKISRSRSRYED